MDSDYYSSDEDCEQQILVENIPKEVTRLYEKADTEEKLNNIKHHLIDLLDAYKLSLRIVEFEDEMYGIYENVIREYIYWQAPGEILDGNDYNLPQKFLEWAYKNTEKGSELEYLDSIYMQLTHLIG
jgi:hypothetical protein